MPLDVGGMLLGVVGYVVALVAALVAFFVASSRKAQAVALFVLVGLIATPYVMNKVHRDKRDCDLARPSVHVTQNQTAEQKENSERAWHNKCKFNIYKNW